jgi:hypothetical protein
MLFKKFIILYLIICFYPVALYSAESKVYFNGTNKTSTSPHIKIDTGSEFCVDRIILKGESTAEGSFCDAIIEYCKNYLNGVFLLLFEN